MGRRFLLLGIAVVLAAVAWFAARREDPPDEGLVAEVRVLDPEGAPVHPAQVERVFEGRRVSVGKDGARRLRHVVLREGDRPSAEAFARALRPLARYHAAWEPRALVEKREDGAYDVRFVLHPCGLLRLHVAPTHLGACRAFPHAVDPGGRWARVGAHGVARAGSVIDYRVFEGTDEIVLRIEGDPDADGAIGVATRQHVVAAPSPGHVVQYTIEPEPVAPILGRIAAADGPTPPSWAGRLELAEVTPEGRSLPWGAVPIEDDGSFVVRTTGAVTYELTAHVWCVPAPFSTRCEGGESAVLRPDTSARWAVITHRGEALDERPLTWDLHAADDPDVTATARVLRQAADRTTLAVPGGRRWSLRAHAAGTPTAPPLRSRPVVLDGTVPGVREAEATLEVAPHGTLVVETTPDAWEGVRSARVVVDGRGATLVRDAAESVEIHNVVAGPQHVRVEWADEEETVTHADVEVAADGRTAITLRR